MRDRKNVIRNITLAGILLAASCDNANRLPSKVTFTEHIAPLLYQNCTICHRPNGNAHFSLVSYQDAKNYAASIAFTVREHMMPPWPADPHYTEFIGQRILSEHDIRLIEKWVQDGTEEGAKSEMPVLPEYPTGSLIGKPDMRIPVQPYMLQEGSNDKFLLVKVPFELPKDTYAALIEFSAGNSNVVHHVNGDMVKYEFDKKNTIVASMLSIVAKTEPADTKLNLLVSEGPYL